MDARSSFILWICALSNLCNGNFLPSGNEPALCGAWKAYKEEKCVNIADKASPQTQDDGEVVCNSYQDIPNESRPRLLTIKSKEEQEFVQRYLFVEKQLVDNVWLGLRKNDRTGLFEWNDGTEFKFHNWANDSRSEGKQHCVEIASGDGLISAGLWVLVSCEKKNAVICEKLPNWTLETIQSAFLNFKLEVDERFQQYKNELAAKEKTWEQKLLKNEMEMEIKNNASIREINFLKNNPVPIGFLYAQLPNQEPPAAIWPNVTWADVSSTFAGNFFRVVGGNAAAFGSQQTDDSPRLYSVQYVDGSGSGEVYLSPGGGFSNAVGIAGADGRWQSLRFRLSSASEVRPRNQAIKIWKRTE